MNLVLDKDMNMVDLPIKCIDIRRWGRGRWWESGEV